MYLRLKKNGSFESIPSSQICVGHVILVNTNQRVPADLLLVSSLLLFLLSFFSFLLSPFLFDLFFLFVFQFQ